jgi:ANTAR domain
MTGQGAAEVFERELAAEPPPELAGPELLPARWARAAARGLGVDGAGVSMHDDGGLATPLGASDRDAARAEQLQFTFGHGPCLRVHDTGRTITFDEADLERFWPQLHGSLVGETPFRAVLSTPLLPPLGPTLVLDLYLRDPEEARGLDRDAVEEVTVALTRQVVRAVSASGRGAEVPWWRAPEARGRAEVWQAMGVLAVQLRLDPADALAVLRAHAVASGRVVEDVAADVVAGRLAPGELDAAPDAR